MQRRCEAVMFSKGVVAPALKPAVVLLLVRLRVQYRIPPCSAAFSSVALQHSFSQPKEGIGQSRVHFSSHKNPYTGIFLRGLERIPRPRAGKAAEGVGGGGIIAHFAPHKNPWAHLECCCWRPLAEGPLPAALKAVPEDYRSDEEGRTEDHACFHTTDVCV